MMSDQQEKQHKPQLVPDYARKSYGYSDGVLQLLMWIGAFNKGVVRITEVCVAEAWIALIVIKIAQWISADIFRTGELSRQTLYWLAAFSLLPSIMLIWWLHRKRYVCVYKRTAASDELIMRYDRTNVADRDEFFAMLQQLSSKAYAEYGQYPTLLAKTRFGSYKPVTEKIPLRVTGLIVVFPEKK